MSRKTKEELQVQTFQHELFGEVRTTILNNEPWFVLKDVCLSFGEQNYRRVASRLDDEEKGVSRIATLGGVQNMIIVNEPGIYSALFAMKPEEARGVSDEYIAERQNRLKAFKRWVTSDVLPTIRKTGGYVDDSEFFVDSYFPDADPSTKIVLTTALNDKKRLLEENSKQKNRLDLLTHTDKTYTATEIAKELGMKSPRELNLKLAEKHIQYKCNGTWVLYNEYADRGYTEIKQSANANAEKSYYNRHFTQLGREFVLNLFNAS